LKIYSHLTIINIQEIIIENKALTYLQLDVVGQIRKEPLVLLGQLGDDRGLAGLHTRGEHVVDLADQSVKLGNELDQTFRLESTKDNKSFERRINENK